MAELGTVVALIKSMSGADPAVIEQAVQDWLDDHPEATTTVQDGSITEAKLAQDVLADLAEVEELKEAIAYKTPEMFGAVGDGVTDDSEAVQDAVDAGYDVYFSSNKTYYIPTPITIDHDCHLHGGENTKIITKTPTGGTLNNVFVGQGTKKKTTTLTTDYTSKGNTANSGNKFTLSDMTGIAIGDIMVITATDQYYNYSRQYYYLGATLLIGDIYDGNLYTTSSMPWDIELTANVSAEIYTAPVIIIENLHFEADMESHGNYKHFIELNECKNSVIRNCNFTQMDCGVRIDKCVNTLIESIEMSKSEETEVYGDGYGLYIGSSSNTVVQRMMAICAQAGISLSGTIPNMDTFIRYCQLGSECRRHGIAMHENTYNAVIEDCTLGGLNVLGTGVVNRCRFVKNNRQSGDGGITFCGSNNPDYAVLKVNDCVFESSNGVYVSPSSPQNPIQAYDNIVGLIEIRNCKGGQFTCDVINSQYVLSNVIKNLVLFGWKNCKEVYKTDASIVIEKMAVVDCEFEKTYWINNHNNALLLDNVYDLDFKSTFPTAHKIAVNRDTYGENLLLPENTSISLSSNNASAKFIVTGKNIVSNNASDYLVGSVSGNEGEALVRAVSTGSSTPTIAINSNGEIVFMQKANTISLCLYPVGMVYVKEDSNISMSAKLVNSGTTDPASFKPYIAIVDCATGKVIRRSNGTAEQASAQGTTITHNYGAPANSVAMCYFYCSTAVSNAETTIKEFTARVNPYFAPFVLSNDEEYMAKRLTGDGTILSFGGINNIISSESVFHVQLSADYIGSAQQIPDGTGVSF